MTQDPAWIVSTQALDAPTRAQFSSVCTISNGYLGLKGVIHEDRTTAKPTTIINGVYDLCDMFSTLPASNEERVYLHPEHFAGATPSPAVANLPNPLYIRLFIEGEEVSFARGEITSFTQSFDTRTARHMYQYVYTDARKKKTRVEVEQFAHITEIHRAYMRYRLTPLNYSGTLIVLSGIDGDVVSNVTHERQCTVTEMHAQDDILALDARTHDRGIRVKMRTHTVITPRPDAAQCFREDKAIVTRAIVSLKENTTVTLDKTMVMACDNDENNGLAISPDDDIRTAVHGGYDMAYASHVAGWDDIWQHADITIEGDETAQLWLRFCLCHCSAAAPRYAPLSVPVKLLTGDYYQGNTFYDTDLYIIPLYTFTHPAWTKSFLQWRLKGHENACKIAKNLGYPGAKFAWQSGPEGEECLGKWWRFTHSNIHINADIVYATCQYVAATGDKAFLEKEMTPMILDFARFYAARARHDAATDTYHYDGVSGPDEGHCTSTDNYYTNYLVRFTLRVAAALPDADKADAQQWCEIADKIAFLYDEQTRVYEQFDGFYALEDISDDFFARRRDRKEWFAPVRPYQAIHQPDVEMAMTMFRDEFDDETVHANHAYYYPRTMNFSSMSFAINAITCADAGDLKGAYDNFMITAGSDIDATLTGRGDTAHGLHGTAMGGAWMALVFGLAGVTWRDNFLTITPRVPAHWTGVRFTLVLHGTPIHIAIDKKTITVSAETRDANRSLTIAHADERVTLTTTPVTHTFTRSL